MKSSLTAFLVLLLAQTAQAALPVFEHPGTSEQISKLIAPTANELQKTPALRGSFAQRKFLKDIPRPLNSSGKFVIARAQGIYWHTLLPFDSEFILTPASMVQLDGGNVAVRLDASQQPGLRVVGDVFFSIFALDLSALTANFNLYGMPVARGGWMLGLRPKNAALASVISEAVITGKTRVDKVQLWDTHADRTEILMSSGKSSHSALTPDEAALFKK